MVHQLVRALEKGETAAAELVGKLGGKAETARELAYRLYTISERKKRAQEALSYNGLVFVWRLKQEGRDTNRLKFLVRVTHECGLQVRAFRDNPGVKRATNRFLHHGTTYRRMAEAG